MKNINSMKRFSEKVVGGGSKKFLRHSNSSLNKRRQRKINANNANVRRTSVKHYKGLIARDFQCHHVSSKQWEHQSNLRNVFKLTSFSSLYC